MEIILVIFCLVLLILIFVKIAKNHVNLINPLCVYWLVWSTIVGLYQLKLLDVPSLGVRTLIILGGGGLLFTLGGMVVIWASSEKRSRAPLPQLPDWADELRLRKWLYILLPINLIAMAMKIYSLMTQSGLSLYELLYYDPTSARVLLLEQQATMFISGFPIIQTLLVDLSALSFLSLPLSGVYLALKRKRSVLPMIVVLLSIVQGIATFSRFRIATDLISFGCGFFFTRVYCKRGTTSDRMAKSKPKRYGSIAVMLILAVIGAFIINDIMLKKSLYLSEITDGVALPTALNIYWYLVGPVAGLEVYLNSNATGGYYRGGFTFRFLAKWLARLGIIDAFRVSPTHLPYVMAPYQTNVFTWYRAFYEDFSMVGVFAMPFLIGMLSMIIFLWNRFRLTLAGIVAMSLVATLVIFSYFGFMFSDNYYLILLGTAFVFERLSKFRRGVRFQVKEAEIYTLKELRGR